jgi:hypothetical protein
MRHRLDKKPEHAIVTILRTAGVTIVIGLLLGLIALAVGFALGMRII